VEDISLTSRQLPPLRARTGEGKAGGAHRRPERRLPLPPEGNLTERAYVDFISARLARQQELLGLEQSLREQQAALETLIGAGMPVVSLPKDVE